MIKKALMLTLGHNSSALFFDGEKVFGYEQERLNKVKSSSDFPKDAIDKLLSQKDITNSYLFVSHWYDSFDLSKIDHKNHVDFEYLKNLIEKYDLKYVQLSDDFTHHDAHAYSSLSFLLNFVNLDSYKMFVGDKVHFLVVDGFGNKQEVISIYDLDKKYLTNEDDKVLHLKDRKCGYFSSLGLMYQYATSYCGMKENQDEYKFLGYESHICEVLDSFTLDSLDKRIDSFVKSFYKFINTKYDYSLKESFINVDSLKNVKDNWGEVFDSMLLQVHRENKKDFDTRVIIGYCIQRILEDVLVRFIKDNDVKNLCVSGGVFYNVKLNNRLLKEVEGIFSVMPLAGDQGAAIGMCQKVLGRFNFGDLCLGERETLDSNIVNKYQNFKERIFISNDRIEIVDNLSKLIKEDKIVNFVEGNMEFGPRALCHTSTLALPSSKNVSIINSLNKRNTVMPMAPVMLREFVDHFFDEKLYSRVIGSERFMIITFDYKNFEEEYSGVSHKYPKDDMYSGRPQVIYEDDKKIVKELLINVSDKTKCLVNTSYNVHGNPILYDYNSILEDFRFQCEQADLNNFERPYLTLYVQ